MQKCAPDDKALVRTVSHMQMLHFDPAACLFVCAETGADEAAAATAAEEWISTMADFTLLIEASRTAAEVRMVRGEDALDDERSPAQEALDKYINKRLCVQVTDGRLIFGTLRCTDKDCNLVLAGAEELRPRVPADAKAESTEDKSAALGLGPAPGSAEHVPGYTRTRSLGVVMVGGRHILRIALQETA